MYLIKQVYNPTEHVDDMFIYHLIHSKKWQTVGMIKIKNQAHLAEIIKNLPLKLDYAIIKLNQSYRNTFYYFYPHIKVIIDKKELITIFNAVMGSQFEVYEEAAVSIEPKESMRSTSIDVHAFIESFYNMSSKEEALMYYEMWQMQLPLNNKKVSRIVRIMESYLDEIANYYEMPCCLLE